MRFTKMNGAGNDFIILNNLIEDLPQGVFPTIARSIRAPVTMPEGDSTVWRSPAKPFSKP